MDCIIEVAVRSDVPATERGLLLERFAKSLLETQNYHVEQQVRLTGTEVDLLAREQQTGERILVECKAYRNTLSADAITKLYGVVAIKNYAAGWLISTGPLSKDAKGLREEWDQQAGNERRKLQIYDPDQLIKRLRAAGLVCDPALLPTQQQQGDTTAYLLITPDGQFWARPVLDVATGLRSSVLVFDARTGAAITTEQTLARLSETDTTLASLSWARAASSPSRPDRHIQAELQSIVQVASGDHWADYRPARPQDYVGRDQILNDVFSFFDRARARTSQTRLLAIKGPSGWGKSSTLIKIAARARNRRHRNRAFVFAVDCRAAVSRRYPEMALYAALKAAGAAGFISLPDDLSMGGTANPFATAAMRDITTQLEQQDRILCLFFDQFEELLYREELAAIFDEVRNLCSAVDELQGNVVIGFSWKTDASIPAEHQAYHLWHALSDRRVELGLSPFSKREISTALTHFSKELGEPVAPQLRRLLSDHCQGYPWLLKKLCIHILELVRGGRDQVDVLSRALSIDELFQRDMEGLSADECGCVRQVAAESPAEFFRIVETYGDDVVNALLHKRLIIRSGARLTLYWDIFRDYILTERVPNITVSYIPQAMLAKYVDGLRFLLEVGTTSYAELAAHLDVTKSTADNIARDFVTIGHAEAKRAAEQLSALHGSEREAARSLLSFCQSHVMYQSASRHFGVGKPFAEEDFTTLMKTTYRGSNFSSRTWRSFSHKILRWFKGVGLIAPSEKLLVLKDDAVLLALPAKGTVRVPRWREFVAEAPPSKVLAVLSAIAQGENSRDALEDAYGRNSVQALRSLGGCVEDRGGRLRLVTVTGETEVTMLRDIAGKARTIEAVRELLAERPGLSGEDVGSYVAERFGYKWSLGSKRRTGAALKRWVRWVEYVDSHEDDLFSAA